jgi:hypothetical protein
VLTSNIKISSTWTLSSASCTTTIPASALTCSESVRCSSAFGLQLRRSYWRAAGPGDAVVDGTGALGQAPQQFALRPEVSFIRPLHRVPHAPTAALLTSAITGRALARWIAPHSGPSPGRSALCTSSRALSTGFLVPSAANLVPGAYPGMRQRVARPGTRCWVLRASRTTRWGGLPPPPARAMNAIFPPLDGGCWGRGACRSNVLTCVRSGECGADTVDGRGVIKVVDGRYVSGV